MSKHYGISQRIQQVHESGRKRINYIIKLTISEELKWVRFSDSVFYGTLDERDAYKLTAFEGFNIQLKIDEWLLTETILSSEKYPELNTLLIFVKGKAK